MWSATVTCPSWTWRDSIKPRWSTGSSSSGSRTRCNRSRMLARSGTSDGSRDCASLGMGTTSIACCWSAAWGLESPRWAPMRLGHDDTTAHNTPIDEIMDGDIDVVQRVFLGVQGDAALSVEVHQFDQL